MIIESGGPLAATGAHLLKALTFLVQASAWLGGQGTRAVAVLVFVGIALPPLGEALKPFVTDAIFFLLCISFMRVDVFSLRGHLQRPTVIIAAVGWTALVIPIVAGLACLAAGVDRHAPELFLGIMLQAVASPMMAAPALASLMGLDATLALVTLVAGTALVPFTAPLYAHAFFSAALTISPAALGLKLLAILAGSLLLATAIRRRFGLAAIERHRHAIDGLNILFMLVFVTAVMSTVAARLLAAPVKVLAIAAFAFAVFFALLGSTALIFSKLGREQALALGLAVSQRNMGLMLAATEGVLPGTTWLYFALCQFPIYLSPQLLRPTINKKPA